MSARLTAEDALRQVKMNMPEVAMLNALDRFCAGNPGLQPQTDVEPGELPKVDDSGGLRARRRRLPAGKEVGSHP
jgi:hypothetical protein